MCEQKLKATEVKSRRVNYEAELSMPFILDQLITIINKPYDSLELIFYK
jgi:hypothetical protein